MMREKEASVSGKNRLMFSILLSLFALVSVVAATVAWFTIADFTKVHSMSMEITSGTNLRFDLDSHANFEDYVKTLSFSAIAARIQEERGFDIRRTPLEPVTTSDCLHFTYENGEEVSEYGGAYQEFVLHFMATEDMLVHLTSQNSEGAQDGSQISSPNPVLPEAMRISFTADGKTYVFDPGMGDRSSQSGGIKTFGLPASQDMVLSEKNQLFWLEKNVDKPVTVRIWLEGTDPACTDEVRNAMYRIALRFVGTDENNHILDGGRQ